MCEPTKPVAPTTAAPFCTQAPTAALEHDTLYFDIESADTDLLVYVTAKSELDDASSDWTVSVTATTASCGDRDSDHDLVDLGEDSAIAITVATTAAIAASTAAAVGGAVGGGAGVGKKKEPRPVSVGHAPQIAEEVPPGDAAEEIRKDKAPPSTEGALTKVDNDDLGEEL